MRGWLSKLAFISFCFLGMYHISSAQQNKKDAYFIYIQNEEGTPFYVKTGDTLLSSTSAGYLVLSQLSQGKYNLTIGFPKNEIPEASFNINLGRSDKGFLIKEKKGSFLLYNLQDHQVIEPDQVASAPGNRIVAIPDVSSGNKKEGTQDDTIKQLVAVNKSDTTKNTAAPQTELNPFEKMLNAVTKTSSTSAKQPPAPAEPEKETPVKDTVKALVGVNQPTSEPESQKQQKVETPVISHHERSNVDAESMPEKQPEQSLQFITFDTASSQEVNEQPPPQPEIVKKTKSGKENAFSFDSILHKLSVKADQPEKTKSVANPLIPGNDQIGQQDERESSQPENNDSGAAIINSDCQHLADNENFQKVQRKMASRKNDESMYKMAKKYFSGGICYATAQIQSLAYLFSTDQYRYKFLELAYPHAYDSDHFASLLKTLSSNYYRGRFKAMVR